MGSAVDNVLLFELFLYELKLLNPFLTRLIVSQGGAAYY